MPVRTVTAVGFPKVTEIVGGGLSAGNAKTSTATTVSASTNVVNTATGADCTVQLDFTISSHQIAYGDRNTADSGSAKETITVRQHEFGHVGARNALANATLLTALCNDVSVNWKFQIKSSGNLAADQATLNATQKSFEDAVENYINPIIDFLDESVVHATQRNAAYVGVKSNADVQALLGAISYTDPVTTKSKAPSNTVMAQAATAATAGMTSGQTFAKNNPTPAGVKPVP
jgi:hypothetical protein